MSNTDKLKQIKEELLTFTESPLYEYRTSNNYFPVIGEGNHNAEIIVIGEAPGEKEALSGRPFCGAAGRVLDELLNTISLIRSDIYITNIVKDRPPGNRDPTPQEIALYAPFLTRQIDIIQPKVIVTLGRFSMKFILELFACPEFDKPISMLHGELIKTNASYGPIRIFPMYHPAAALYKPPLKNEMKADMVKLSSFLGL